MKLRIISGSLRGRYIQIPQKDSRFRPTLERTRQSLAEIIKNRIPGARAADLCAGSGAMGFEMISRGAASVDFVEKDRMRAEVIRRNAREFGVEEQSRIIVQDIRAFIRSAAVQYDIIFFDPPYDDAEINGLVPSIVPLIAPGGIFLYEHSRKNDVEFEGVQPAESRVFGDTIVDFYGM